jgi:hypothetical protein
MSQNHLISVEAAGAGFAAAIALAERFRGEELGSIQALQAAGIELVNEAQREPTVALTQEERAEAVALCREVRTTLTEQAEGWQQRPSFERQVMHASHNLFMQQVLDPLMQDTGDHRPCHRGAWCGTGDCRDPGRLHLLAAASRGGES